MSRSSLVKLDTRCCRHCGTITLYQENGDDVSKFRSTLVSWFKLNDTILHFYLILHDDADKLHYHYIIIYTSNVRLRTTIYRLSDLLNIDVTQIGVEKLTNLNSYLRYFLHLDEDDEKKRYDVSCIISDENISRLEDYINTDDDILSSTRLIQLVLLYSNEVDIMNYLGLATFHKYRYEIRLLMENTYYLSQRYSYLKPEFSKDANDLPFGD